MAILASALTQCSNGNLLISWYDLNGYSVLSRIDAAGNVVWSNTLHDSINISDHRVYSIGENSDGSIWIMGTHVDTNYQRQYFLSELSASGSVNWARFYQITDPSMYYGPSCYKMYDGGYMINLCVPSHLQILRTDSAGNLLWTGTFQTDVTVIKHPGISGTPTYDGGFVIAGIETSNIVLVKVNTAGTVQWGTRFNPTLSSTARTVCELADGHVIVGGATTGGAFLAKVNHLNGDVLWFKIYNDSIISFSSFMHVHPATDGSFFAIVPSMYTSTGNNCVLRIDANGNVINSVKYTTSLSTNYTQEATMLGNNNELYLLNSDPNFISPCELTKVGNTFESGCNLTPLNIIVTNITPPLLSTILTAVWPGTDGIEVTGPIINAYSITNDVLVECLPTGSIESEKEEISIYPNPISPDGEFRLNTNNQGTWMIFDTYGRCVAEGMAVGGGNTISLAPFSKGVYILAMKNNTGETIMRQKLIWQ